MCLRKHLLSVFFILLTTFATVSGQKTDPYHLATGGYGKLLSTDTGVSVWWCEGDYKLMRDTPVPGYKSDTIVIQSAKNEHEPFQLILFPDSRIEDLRIIVSDLVSGKEVIRDQSIKLRKVEYVKITKPTDSYGYTGYWPDPLPEIEGPVTVFGGENTGFWIDIFVPADAHTGIYHGTVELVSPEWSQIIPIQLEVWDFTLPEIPSLRSGFGLSVDKITEYHNLVTNKEIRETFDLYMKAFREYRIAPYDPFYLYPIKEKVTGLEWEGGIFDYENSFNGEYSYRIEDDSPSASPSASYKKMIEIDSEKNYTLSWKIKAEKEESRYCILLDAYDKEGHKLMFDNKMEVFTSDTIWSGQTYSPGTFSADVSYISLSVFPAFRTIEGEEKGIIWLDNILFREAGGNNNILNQGDFEVDANDVDIELDFSDFDYAGRRYLDEFGFNSFRLYLKGMGSGTYYSRKEGIFEGFVKGSPVYDSLMEKYLRLMEAHLKEKGWLGKEYVYWFDEPGEKDYPFVRDGMETIKKSAPGINTFITENEPGPEIMDVTDITCTIFHRVNPDKAREIVNRGQEYWSYLCTAPKAPWISLFIDHDAINLRMWLWMTYAWDLNGILIWSSNYWNSYSASPSGYLQNPWTEPASFVQGYGWPYGKQTVWGNGDGRLLYPPNRNPNTDGAKYLKGPVPSLRLEHIRQGIEDYEYLVILESLLQNNNESDRKTVRQARKLLDFEGQLFKDGKTYSRNPEDIHKQREKVAKMIISLKK